ncbi:MAG: hypothetical protein AB7W16_07525 [Candidatus Obscuribacterales bacterium]
MLRQVDVTGLAAAEQRDQFELAVYGLPDQALRRRIILMTGIMARIMTGIMARIMARTQDSKPLQRGQSGPS